MVVLLLEGNRTRRTVTRRKPNKISEEGEMDPSIVISTKSNDKVLLELGCCRHSSEVEPQYLFSLSIKITKVISS